jgi:CMP-N-acetylneuraminic acid synthetase
MAYSIRAAIDSGIFARVYLATDSPQYAEVGESYGATWWRRAKSGPTEPDFDWVKGVVETDADYFAILRPTSPFRTARTIRRAWDEWVVENATGKTQPDSMRAISPAKTNPYKMWWYSQDRNRIEPIMDDTEVYWAGAQSFVGWGFQPRHSIASQSLPPAWAQNASLEIARMSVIGDYGNISGREVMPFFSMGHEGIDLNTEDDWSYAEWLVRTRRAVLPEV